MPSKYDKIDELNARLDEFEFYVLNRGRTQTDALQNAVAGVYSVVKAATISQKSLLTLPISDLNNITSVMKNSMILLEGNTNDKKKALNELLQSIEAFTKDEGSDSNQLMHDEKNVIARATQALYCIAWATACVVALAAYYTYTFPVGVAIDVGYALTTNQPPPVFSGMMFLAAAPMEMFKTTSQDKGSNLSISTIKKTVSEFVSTATETQNLSTPDNSTENMTRLSRL